MLTKEQEKEVRLHNKTACIKAGDIVHTHKDGYGYVIHADKGWGRATVYLFDYPYTLREQVYNKTSLTKCRLASWLIRKTDEKE